MTSTPWSRRASQTTSAPIRVRFRGRASSSIARRAASTAAAWAVPSPGMWLRRAGPVVGFGGAEADPFVIVIALLPSLSCVPPPRRSPPAGPPSSWLAGHQKTPAVPGEGPVCLRWSVRLAPVPPSSSVLPPGAGNEEADEAVKTDEERAKKGEERTVREARVVHGHLHAAAVRRDDDGDVAAIVPIEQTQDGLPNATRPTRAVRAVYEALRDRATTRNPRDRTCRHEASRRVGRGWGSQPGRPVVSPGREETAGHPTVSSRSGSTRRGGRV